MSEEVNAYYAFESLPKDAQKIALTWAIVSCPDMMCALLETNECESPIEKMFSLAFSLARAEFNMIQTSIQDSFEDGYVVDVFPQFEMDANGNSYRVDFLIYAWHTATNKDLNLVVECDGHDFHHATKEQVKHDNEREYDLKMAGNDVLRFSGAQLYENSLKCAIEVIDYIKAKVGPEEDADGDIQNDPDVILD